MLQLCVHLNSYLKGVTHNQESSTTFWHHKLALAYYSVQLSGIGKKRARKHDTCSRNFCKFLVPVSGLNCVGAMGWQVKRHLNLSDT